LNQSVVSQRISRTAHFSTPQREQMVRLPGSSTGPRGCHVHLPRGWGIAPVPGLPRSTTGVPPAPPSPKANGAAPGHAAASIPRRGRYRPLPRPQTRALIRVNPVRTPRGIYPCPPYPGGSRRNVAAQRAGRQSLDRGPEPHRTEQAQDVQAERG